MTDWLIVDCEILVIARLNETFLLYDTSKITLFDYILKRFKTNPGPHFSHAYGWDYLFGKESENYGVKWFVYNFLLICRTLWRRYRRWRSMTTVSRSNRSGSSTAASSPSPHPTIYPIPTKSQKMGIKTKRNEIRTFESF